MIFVDTTFFGHDEVRAKKLNLSTSLVTADLLDAFCKLGRAKDFCLIVNYNHEKFIHERFPDFELCILKNPIVSLLAKITKKPLTKLLKIFGTFRKTVEKKNPTLIWFPCAMPRTFIKTKIPSVITVHDIYRVHSDGLKLQFEKMFASAIKTVAVSEYTKNDILKNTDFEKCSKNPISVVPNSIVFELKENDNFIPTGELAKLSNKKFILDINAYIEKKNTLTLLSAFDKIKNQTDTDLVLCGGYKEDEYFEKICTFVSEKKLDSRIHIFYRIPENERNWLLKNASLFVTPSLFEGFGRTPVEAAISGIPVISTKETSLFEATMGLCNYVENAKNPDEYASLMLELLENPPTKEKLSELAETLKKQYTPISCTEKYLEIFEETND